MSRSLVTTFRTAEALTTNPEDRFLTSKYNPLRGYWRANARLLPLNVISVIAGLALLQLGLV